MMVLLLFALLISSVGVWSAGDGEAVQTVGEAESTPDGQPSTPDSQPGTPDGQPSTPNSTHTPTSNTLLLIENAPSSDTTSMIGYSIFSYVCPLYSYVT